MPTRKQQTEQDDRQRKRVRRVIFQHVQEMNARPFEDAMARLRAIPDSEWKAAVEQDALAVQAAKGKGPGRGWWGPPHGTHGKTLGKIPGHVWERAGQRTGYKAVKDAVRTLRQNPVLPPSRDQQWHMPLTVGGQLRGYLVGSDSFAQTVLGASMKPKAGSAEIVVQAEKGKGPGRGWWGPPKGTHGLRNAPTYGNVKEELFDRIQKVKPELTEDQLEMYEGIMGLDREKFLHYAKKIGVEGDLSDLADRYFKEQGEMSRARAKARWDDEADRSLRKPGTMTDYQYASSENKERWNTPRPGTVDDLKTELNRRGIDVVSKVDTDPERMHRELSQLLNIMDDNPMVTKVMGDHVKRVVYAPDRKPGDTASAAYDWRHGGSLEIYPFRGFDLPPSVWIHEIGHAAEEYAKSGHFKRGFGDGHIASMYGSGNPSEDWAELFLASFGGAWTRSEIRAWMPDKYDYMMEVLEGAE